MCGRFLQDIDKEEMRKIVDAVNRAIAARSLEEQAHTGEIAPTNNAAVFINTERGAAPTLMKWGFPGYLPPGSKAKQTPVIINARSETAAEKPTFRDYIYRQRCLVPANLYYEWPDTGTKKKPKFEFQPVDESLGIFWMAAIYRKVADNTLPVFTILTMEPSESVAPLHNRMPVILGNKEARRIWMSGERDFLGLFRDTVVRDIRHRPCGEIQMGLV